MPHLPNFVRRIVQRVRDRAAAAQEARYQQLSEQYRQRLAARLEEQAQAQRRWDIQYNHWLEQQSAHNTGPESASEDDESASEEYESEGEYDESEGEEYESESEEDESESEEDESDREDGPPSPPAVIVYRTTQTSVDLSGIRQGLLLTIDEGDVSFSLTILVQRNNRLIYSVRAVWPGQ